MKASQFLLVFLTVARIATYGQIKTTVQYDCDVYANTNIDYKIYSLKKNDTVTVNSYYHKNKVYFITKDSIQGYVYNGNIKNSWELSNMKSDGESQAIKGQYWIGMTKSDASRALGSSDQASTRTGTWGTTDTWIYKKRNLTLMFENDKLTAYRTEQSK